MDGWNEPPESGDRIPLERREFVALSAAGLAAGAGPVSAATPEAPLDHADLLAVARLDTPTVANAIETFDMRPCNEGFMRPEIRSVFPDSPSIAGYAVTCKIRAREPRPSSGSYVQRVDWWDFIVSVPPPRIVVIEDLDDPPGVGSFRGEVNGSIHQALGCLGVVTNGGVRDLKEVREMGFHYFAQHVVVSHAYVHQVEFGKPVRVGGVTVSPGDLVHADRHGVHTVPLGIAAEIPDAAARIYEREHRVIDFCHSPGFTLDGLKELVGG